MSVQTLLEDNNVTLNLNELKLASSGNAAMVAGTVTVPYPTISANDLVFATTKDNVVSGILKVQINAGVSFTITCSAPQNANISWIVLRK